MSEQVLGIDIGGSGIKGALVDLEKGDFASDRLRLDTPKSGKPEPVLSLITKMVAHFAWKGPIGIGFPGVVRENVIHTAVNLNDDWVGFDLGKAVFEATGCRAAVLNDADSAGLAEMRFGEARGRRGVVIVVTLGTGIGTALFTEGRLVQNTELGHVYFSDGQHAESFAAERARKEDDLKWPEWGARVNRYLNHIQYLFWPELIVIGGGVSKKFDKWSDQLDVKAEVVPAALLNKAGIVGAAMWAAEQTA